MLKYMFLIFGGLLASDGLMVDSEILKSESNLKLRNLPAYEYLEETIHRKIICEITKWCYLKRISEKYLNIKSEKNDCFFDDTKMQQQIFTFLLSASKSSTDEDCKKSPFACIDFPCDILQYLGSYGQYRLNKLGSFSTRPTDVKKLSLFKRYTKHLDANTNKLSAYALQFNDPFWRLQWYMHDYRTSKTPVMDHNIVPVLKNGITGLMVTVAIISDGVRKHADLGNNYDSLISYDFCTNKQGSTPKMRWLVTRVSYNNVGTSSAGVIAMKADNNFCGVGVAPNARIAGYRVEGCNVVEYSLMSHHEKALKYQLETIHIYCNLWLRKEALVKITPGISEAYEKGALEGRNGLGAIYIMSSGGNRDSNICATNGYNNNPYVITIASANQHGKPASYSERCTAVFATAYSGDSSQHTEGIVSIHADGRCKTSFNGRPAGPAIASGIIALLLEANPPLSYRDVMHLIAMTSEVAPLANNVGTWYKNSGGFWVSNDFGFGLLNAENMIMLAKKWVPVEKKKRCELKKKFGNPLVFKHGTQITIAIDASTCSGDESGISYLEHVELEIFVDSNYRGAVSMDIISPSGTTSSLLEPRPKDTAGGGYKGWTIMSVHNWGEDPKGMWHLRFTTIEKTGLTAPHGSVDEVTLTFHGLQDRPAMDPRVYAPFRIPKRRLKNAFNKFVPLT